MSMFPAPGATILKNEAGEVLGWDYPSYEPEYNDDDFYEMDYEYGECQQCKAECDPDEPYCEDCTPDPNSPHVGKVFNDRGLVGHIDSVTYGDTATYHWVGDNQKHSIEVTEITTWLDEDLGGWCPYLEDDDSTFCWECGQVR